MKPLRFIVCSSACLCLSAGTAFAVEFESNGSLATATPLQCDISEEGRIEPVGDADYFSLIVAENSIVTAEVQCATGDSTLTLYDASGSQVGFSDDDGVLLCSRISATLSAGLYYFAVREFADDGVMPYSLLVSCVSQDDRAAKREPTRLTCDIEAFHAFYGDGDHSYDATAQSTDRFDSYGCPGNFLSSIPGAPGSIENTDNPASPANRVYPFCLGNYCTFDPAAVEAAFFRLDFFYERRDVYGNDSIAFYDDSLGLYTAGFGFAAALQSRLITLGQNRNQWVSIVMDLRSGRVFASEVDSFGSVQAPDCYGQIGSLTATAARTILNAAADGDLQGYVQDDMRIGMVSLIGAAYPPVAPYCPDSWLLIKGSDTSGQAGLVPSWLCASDNSYLRLWSAKLDGKHRVEWKASFQLPAGAPCCSMTLRTELRTSGKPLSAQIQMLRNDNVWVTVGNVPCGERNDIERDTTIPNCSQFVNPSTGKVWIKVYAERSAFLIPRFEMNADVLRLTVR